MINLDLVKQMISFTHDLCFVLKDDLIVASNNVSRYMDTYDEKVVDTKITDLVIPEDTQVLITSISIAEPKHNIRLRLIDHKEYSFNIAKIAGYTVLLGEDTDSNKYAEESNRQLCIAVNEMSEGVVIISKTGNITFANNAVIKFMGLNSYDDVINKNISVLFEKKGSLCVAEKIKTDLLNKGSWAKKLKLITVDGGMLPVDVSFTLVKGNGSICLIRDISHEEKIKKEKRKQLVEDLSRITGLQLDAA